LILGKTCGEGIKSTDEIANIKKSNIYGQLGIEDNKNQVSPVLTMKDEQIEKICCGPAHIFVLKKNGENLAFGRNEQGQLGLGNVEKQSKPVLMMKEEQISILLGGEKKLFEWNPQIHSQFDLPFQNRIFTFLLSLNRFQHNTTIKLPKFILFEIIKKTL